MMIALVPEVPAVPVLPVAPVGPATPVAPVAPDAPVAPVTPTTVPAPSVFAAPFYDVVVASNASIDRAVTVSSSPIAV